MTTKVKVEAECSEDFRVRVSWRGSHAEEIEILKGGEDWQGYVYDDRVITVEEFRADDHQELPLNGDVEGEERTGEPDFGPVYELLESAQALLDQIKERMDRNIALTSTPRFRSEKIRWVDRDGMPGEDYEC